MNASCHLIQCYLRSQRRWLQHHLVQEGFFLLCSFGILSLWMYMLQDLLHHKIGVLSPVIYERIATSFCFFTFILVAWFVGRCIEQVESSVWWKFHSRNGGSPHISCGVKNSVQFLLSGILILFTIFLCSALFGTRPLWHWLSFSFFALLGGVGLARLPRRQKHFASSPPCIPSFPVGALAWGVLRPFFLFRPSFKVVIFCLALAMTQYILNH